MRRTKESKKRKTTACTSLFPLLVVCAALLFVSSIVSAQTKHPLYVYDEFISICFFPLEKTVGKSNDMDIRELITSSLRNRDAFDYLFSFPKDTELETLYARAFHDRKGPRWPDPKYWSKNQIHYVVFGNCSTTSEQLIVEVCLYDAQNDSISMYKRYQGLISEKSELAMKITDDMEQKLLQDPENTGRKKHRDKPREGKAETNRDKAEKTLGQRCALPAKPSVMEQY
jgi:hypothetical protein